MTRITCAAMLLSVVLFAVGCGQRAAEEPVVPPPDTPPVETPEADMADEPEAPVVPEMPADPVMSEDPDGEPDPGEAAPAEQTGEVDQKRVLGAVGNSLLGSFGLGRDKGADEFEEAPPF